jgi:prepilin-type N-terminal cleavage/methylation domain-containing protein
MDYKKQTGFTIVELLIVIVVIGILAAISIVAYNGVQNRANDTAVQNDISGIVKKIRMYEADAGYYPAGSAQLATLGIKVSKNAYTPYFNGTANYNLVYCRMPNVNPTQFALIAYGKSGKNFQYSASGQLSEFTGAPTGSATACAAAGVPLSTGSERDWFYDNNAWQYYVAG